MIYREKPKDFQPVGEVVSCFVESEGRILLLKRHPDAMYGGRWGVPTGKVELSETVIEAVVREAREESGIALPIPSLKFCGTFYVRHSRSDRVWHLFHILLPSTPDVQVNAQEHTDFRWLTPGAALHLDLVPDVDASIQSVFAVGKEVR